MVGSENTRDLPAEDGAAHKKRRVAITVVVESVSVGILASHDTRVSPHIFTHLRDK